MTREIPGRRINLQSPQESLLINKALGNVDHTGGQLIVDGSHEYETLLAGKIEEGRVIDRLLQENPDPMSVVTSLYERCLSRQPTAGEATAINERLNSSADVKASLSDLFWALLNSNEFVFNH